MINKEAFLRRESPTPLSTPSPRPAAVATLAPRADAARAPLGAQAPLRILWVKVGGLWPANTGGRLRSYHIISELSRRHELSVLSTHLPSEDPEELRRQLPWCKRVQSWPYQPTKRNSARFLLSLARSWLSPLPVDLHKNRIAGLRRGVDEALASGDYDLCVADFLFAVPNVRLGGPTPVVFFSHNVEYMIWKRLCAADRNPLRRLLLALEWRKMRRCEAAACRRSRLTVAVSEEDSRQLREHAPGCRVQPVPTGVDIQYFRPGEPAEEQALELVFTGSMDWHPNEDGILWFLDSVLPLIRARAPGLHLTVVGRNPSAAVRAAAVAAQVSVTGTVDDIRPYVRRAQVYVVPLRIGGGTRLKIYEALAMGKAVLSTTIGAEGLPLTEGEHILRADDPEQFAAQTLRLLDDAALRRRLGEAGRRLMEERFAWPRVAEAFEALCREALRA